MLSVLQATEKWKKDKGNMCLDAVYFMKVLDKVLVGKSKKLDCEMRLDGQ